MRKGGVSAFRDAGTQTVLRAAAVLNCFSEERPEWSVAELSKELDLNQSTVGRLVATLESVGYLHRQKATNRLRVGLKIAGLAFVALNQVDMRRVSLPILEELSRTTNLNGTLAIAQQGSAIYIARVEASSLFPGNYVLGRMPPLHSSAVGKILLAYLVPEGLERELKAICLTRYTEQTITEMGAFRSHLSEVLERGYATDRGEWLPNVGCIAAPVRNQFGTVVAAVGVSGPLDRLDELSPEDLVRAVLSASRKISYSLGYLGALV